MLFGLCLLLEPLGGWGGLVLRSTPGSVFYLVPLLLLLLRCLLGSTARLVQACTVLTNVGYMYLAEVAQDNLEVGWLGRLPGRHWDCWNGTTSWFHVQAGKYGKQQKRGKVAPRKVAFRRIFAHAKFDSATW